MTKHRLPEALSFLQERRLLDQLQDANRIATRAGLVVAERVAGAVAGPAPHLDDEAWAVIERALADAHWPADQVARWRRRIEDPLVDPTGDPLLASLVDLVFQVGWERCRDTARQALKERPQTGG